MSLTLVLDVVAGACFLVGSTLALIAAVGILRFPDVLARLHSGTKPQVVGLLFLLVGLATQLRNPASYGLLVLVVVFQLVTSPVATHMLARAHYRAGRVRPGDLVVDELTPVLGEDEGPRGAP